MIQVREALLQAPQTADASFQHATSAGVLLGQDKKTASLNAYALKGTDQFHLKECVSFSRAHLSFELAVDVHQDETRDLYKRDDEGAFGQSTQMVTDGPRHGGEDGGRWQLGLIP